MQPQTDGDYAKLLTEVIKKQIAILGPYITLAKARKVQGLVISDDGTVTSISGNPQELTQQLINQFMELSGLIVKKTMEPLVAMHSGFANPPAPITPQFPIETAQPVQPVQAPAAQQF